MPLLDRGGCLITAPGGAPGIFLPYAVGGVVPSLAGSVTPVRSSLPFSIPGVLQKTLSLGPSENLLQPSGTFWPQFSSSNVWRGYYRGVNYYCCQPLLSTMLLSTIAVNPYPLTRRRSISVRRCCRSIPTYECVAGRESSMSWLRLKKIVPRW